MTIHSEESYKRIHRRKFIKSAGLGLIGAAFIKDVWKEIPFVTSPSRIGLQLYTVRNQIKEDIERTLHRVAGFGFDGVETAFWPDNVSIAQAGKYLKDAGLSVCSAHIELPTDDKKKADMLSAAEAYRCKRMIWHGWPEDKRYSSLEGTKELADIYNQSYAFAKSHGLEFGLHNHWWEFRNKVDGRFVYQVLLERVDPGIFFEIDTYWVKVAGHDPVKIVGEFGKRARYLHIKDGPAKWNDALPADNPDPMVAVGKGSQNFPAIMKAADGNTEWMIVEMDKVATDVFAAIQDSYDYLVKNGFAK